MKKINLILILTVGALAAHAQLAVTVSPVKITGQTAVVPLAIQNNLSEKVESAKAVVFLTDEQGKMAGTATRWVIGGTPDKSGLAAGATNAFNFVLKSDKPFMTTNLSAKVTFSRIVLEGGKLADVAKQVTVTPPAMIAPGP